MTRAAAIAALVAALAADARAEGVLDLAVRDEPRPAPSSLAMRAADPGDAQPAPTSAAAPAAKRSLRERIQDAFTESFLDLPRDLSDVEERVVFHLDLGFALDGGEPLPDPLLTSGAPLLESGAGAFYNRLRVYTFGDAVIGSRGLLMPSLATYFAAQFRFEQSGTPLASARPSVYDSSSGNAVLPRHAYGEIRDAFDNRWLRPLFFRFGRQFRYGAAIAHFDGATIGYDTRAVSIGAFGGQRVSLYGLDQAFDEPSKLITGSNIRIDLYHINRWPVALESRVLQFDGIANSESGLAWRVSRDVFVRGKLRYRDQKLSREHLNVRARLSDTATLQVAFDNRHDRDWAYDLVVAEPSYGADDPRRFLAFGVPRPRMRLGLLGGTVLMDNLDLLVRAAVAREYGDGEASALHPSYVEGGIAAEARFRRSLRVGSSVLARSYARDDVATEHVVGNGAPEDLPADTGGLGERSYVEADFNLVYDRGAKQFRARADGYVRLYGDPNPLAPEESGFESRPGVRFSIEGWISKHLRFKGEYETAFAPELLAPEIRGAKSLRVLVEGQF